jgi:hypothetical protein
MAANLFTKKLTIIDKVLNFSDGFSLTFDELK